MVITLNPARKRPETTTQKNSNQNTNNHSRLQQKFHKTHTKWTPKPQATKNNTKQLKVTKSNQIHTPKPQPKSM